MSILRSSLNRKGYGLNESLMAVEINGEIAWMIVAWLHAVWLFGESEWLEGVW